MEQGKICAKNGAAMEAIRNNILKEKALNILRNTENLKEKEYRFIALKAKYFLKDYYSKTLDIIEKT